MDTAPLILLAAGGTGGHLFPAEALGVELIKRELRVRLVTDARALRYSGLFSRDMIDVVPSETVRGRNPVALARTAIMLGYGLAVALRLVRRLKPAAVVGFGGFLGVAEKYHPLPWAALDYEPEDNAYVVPFTKDQLMKAPADSLDALTAGDGVGYRNQSYKYYNVPADW